MLKRSSIAAIGLLLAFAGAAMAQTYPTRPITMIIPFAAGGPQTPSTGSSRSA